VGCARGVVELPDDEVRPMLRQVPIKVPGWIGFLKKADMITDGTPDEFEALVGVVPIFRFDPIA
jgi:hypothetical protein